MKRIILFTLVSVLVLFAFTGCSSESKEKSQETGAGNDKKISVVTTIFPQYDFTRQIAGDRANITMLLSPGAESHSFEPTPQDIIKIQNCDVFIYVGGENDEWVRSILESVDTSKMKTIALLDCVNAVEEQVKEGMEDDEDHDHGDGQDDEDSGHDHDAAEGDKASEIEYDEHVWTSPRNAVLIVNSILDALCNVDPDNADFYRSNAESYAEQLGQLDAEFQSVVDHSKRKTILFGDRFPLRYFVDAYGLDYWAAFPGCSAESEPSAATVAFLTDKVKEEQIPVVFQIELSNGNVANSIAEATGAKVLTFYSCHNLSKTDYENGETYLSFMEKNVEALKEALN